MTLSAKLSQAIITFCKEKYKVDLQKIDLQPTKLDFEGDMTLVVFPLLKFIKDRPENIAKNIGEYLSKQLKEIEGYNVIKGFLNLTIKDNFYVCFLNNFNVKTLFQNRKKEAVMVEYSSPNTNKPLHLGHIRNNLLGHSVAKIIESTGREVYRTQIVNDRGIHICKSMVAWEAFGNGETPKKSKLKGDALVGKYYVLFDREYNKEVQKLIDQGISEEEARRQSAILRRATTMLLKWENNDPETVRLWETMNKWVYDGFEKTYQKLGVSFDKIYYESQTYLLGKDIIEEGLQKGIFFKKNDGSVWIDLSAEGLDQKLVLRADGTSVYITQDIGTALKRIDDFPMVNTMVYAVGNEQDYHFKVLFSILKKLGYPWANRLFHLSYGMVDLPEGKMKSREGTVVDADTLIKEMYTTAAHISEKKGKINDFSKEEKQTLFHVIGMGALKFFILKINPKKRILFNPKESVDFNGDTGPFVQYTYTRIQSLLKKADTEPIKIKEGLAIALEEKELVKQLWQLKSTIEQAAITLDPSIIANYCCNLAKRYNSYYQNAPILKTASPTKEWRILLSKKIGQTIKHMMGLLGIDVPERM